MKKLLTVLVMVGLFVSCGKDERNTRSTSPQRDTFSLSATNEETWVRVNAYGHSFLYPAEDQDPKPLRRTPLTIAPYISGLTHQDESVDLVLVINGQKPVTKCRKPQTPDEFVATKTSDANATGAWVTIENERHDNGRFFPFVSIFIVYSDKCTKIFLYDSKLDGFKNAIAWDEETELMQRVRKIIESYRRYD